jgi:hypothetical protein
VRRERARAQCDERRSNDAGAAGGGTNGDVSANDGETESSSCTAARGDKDTAAARGAKEAEGEAAASSKAVWAMAGVTLRGALGATSTGVHAGVDHHHRRPDRRPLPPHTARPSQPLLWAGAGVIMLATKEPRCAKTPSSLAHLHHVCHPL